MANEVIDVTNKNLRIPGVNQDTNFIKQRSYCLNGIEVPEILAVGTHNVIALPRGEAITKIRIVALDATTSGGSATLQFKVAFGEVAENVGTSAVAIANLAAGDVYDFAVNGIKGYEAESGAVIQLSVGAAALTGMKLLVIVETIPVVDFTKQG